MSKQSNGVGLQSTHEQISKVGKLFVVQNESLKSKEKGQKVSKTLHEMQQLSVYSQMRDATIFLTAP